MSILERWQAYRRAQRAALRASNHPHEHDPDDSWERAGSSDEGGLLTALLRRDEPPSGAVEARPGGAPGAVRPGGAPPGAPPGEPRVGERGAGVGPTTGERVATGDTVAPAGPAVSERYGRAGRPLNRQSPFYLGFVGAIGVLTALLIWNTLGRCSSWRSSSPWPWTRSSSR